MATPRVLCARRVIDRLTAPMNTAPAPPLFSGRPWAEENGEHSRHGPGIHS